MNPARAMDSSGSMDYEYENAVRHQEPHHHFAVRTGRGCPALAGHHRPWARADWQPDQRPWHTPAPFFCPPGLPQAHWSPPEPSFLASSSESRGPVATNAREAVPHSAPAPRHSLPLGSIPAISPASVPTNPSEPSTDAHGSPSSTESTAQTRELDVSISEEARRSAPSTPGVHESSTPSVPPSGLDFGASEGQASPRRSTVANSTTNARISLPMPAGSHFLSPEPRARHRLLSDFHRPGVVVARPRDGNLSASPTSSLDDDSDPDIGPRMQMFGLINSARQTQILRGQMPNKRVASRRALASLQKVDLDSLSDSEKSMYIFAICTFPCHSLRHQTNDHLLLLAACVICYNDFGVASPEGNIETPLRLPKCKHVFGDSCIRKWLEDSYSCPYCRDKLDSELAQPSEQFIHRMLATSGAQYLPHAPVIRRLLASNRNDLSSDRAERQVSARRHRDSESGSASTSGRDSVTRGERRSAPSEDSNEVHRRQRPRRDTMPPSRSAAHSYTANHNAVPTPPTPIDPMPLQNPTREPPTQRTPAWHHAQQVDFSRAPPAPHFSSHPPAFHFPRISHTSAYVPTNMPFMMPPLPQPPSPPSNQMPPMLSREDFYTAPPMIRDGGWYNPAGESGSGPIPTSLEPHFPSFGSSSTAVTPGSGVFMPPLAHSIHYQGHGPGYGSSAGPPQLHHPERWNVASGPYYPS